MSRLDCATTFELLPRFFPAYGLCVGPITVERREQRDGSIKWAVMSPGNALTKNGKWEMERLPSSRTEAYLARARFDTLDEAWLAAEKAVRRILRDVEKEHGPGPYKNMIGQQVILPALDGA